MTEAANLARLSAAELLEQFNMMLAMRESCDTCTTYSGRTQDIGALFADNRSLVRKAFNAYCSGRLVLLPSVEEISETLRTCQMAHGDCLIDQLAFFGCEKDDLFRLATAIHKLLKGTGDADR